jgi:hypothetical protein
MQKYDLTVLTKFEPQAREMCKNLGVNPDEQVHAGEYGWIQPAWFAEAERLAVLFDRLVLLGVIEQKAVQLITLP